MTTRPLSIFALGSTHGLGTRVAQHLGVALSPVEERDFEDGEHKVRPLAGVREHDVYVIHSLYGEPGASANDKLVRLLFLIGALRDAGAGRVTAVTPYLCYARKDARTQPRDPVSSRYVAQLIETVGTDRVVALEVHNPAAFANAFRIRAEHLPTAGAFAQALAGRLGAETPIAVVAPDPGGFKRAEQLRAALSARMRAEASLALVEKRRAHGRMTPGELVGDVAGRTALVVDDIVASGGTLLAAAERCRAHGASAVIACVTHGLFVPPAETVLAGGAIDRIMVTDSVPPFRLSPGMVRDRLEMVSIVPLLGEAIRRLHAGESLSELLENLTS